jgi:hypothetical protein
VCLGSSHIPTKFYFLLYQNWPSYKKPQLIIDVFCTLPVTYTFFLGCKSCNLHFQTPFIDTNKHIIFTNYDMLVRITPAQLPLKSQSHYFDLHVQSSATNEWSSLSSSNQKPELRPGLVQHPKKPDDLVPSRTNKLHTKRQQVHISMFSNLL